MKRNKARDAFVTIYGIADKMLLDWLTVQGDGVHQIPADHPAMQIKKTIVDVLHDDRRIDSETIETIRKAAVDRLRGATWIQIAERYGDAFRKNLQDSKRYKPYLSKMIEIERENRRNLGAVNVI